MTRPRRVDFLNNPEDLRVVVLGSLGFTTDYIAGAIGMSPGQVLYRLLRASVKRAEYRRGESVFAQTVVGKVSSEVAVAQAKRLAREQRQAKKGKVAA